MAMECNITATTHTSVKLVKFAWTSDDTLGTASGTTTKYYTGKILGLATDPGSPAPDPDYDITITDSNSLDVLIGSGADRSDTAIEYVKEADLCAVVESQLTLNVSNAGNSKQGVVYLFIR